MSHEYKFTGEFIIHGPGFDCPVRVTKPLKLPLDGEQWGARIAEHIMAVLAQVTPLNANLEAKVAEQNKVIAELNEELQKGLEKSQARAARRTPSGKV